MKQNIINGICIILTFFSIIFNPISIYAEDNPNDDKNIVVALEHGHDTLHTGAYYYGLKEEEINFKIAKYCKEYIERNSNIKVIFTHSSLTCDYPETIYDDCNYDRVKFAAKNNADLFFSIHCNASTNSYSNGISIIYQNENYKSQFNKEGLLLIDKLKNTLSDYMDITEIYTRNSEGDENDSLDDRAVYYPDGSDTDYYNVLRTPKYYDFLSIIVEHGYLSNEDNAYFLSDDFNLQQLGEADAKAIINYYKDKGLNMDKKNNNNFNNSNQNNLLEILYSLKEDKRIWFNRMKTEIDNSLPQKMKEYIIKEKYNISFETPPKHMFGCRN